MSRSKSGERSVAKHSKPTVSDDRYLVFTAGRETFHIHLQKMAVQRGLVLISKRAETHFRNKLRTGLKIIP